MASDGGKKKHGFEGRQCGGGWADDTTIGGWAGGAAAVAVGRSCGRERKKMRGEGAASAHDGSWWWSFYEVSSPSLGVTGNSAQKEAGVTE